MRVANDLEKNVPAEGEKKSFNLNEIQVPNWAAALLIGVVILIGVAVVFGPKLLEGNAQTTGTSFADSPSPDAAEVDVLPQTVRNYDNGSTENPFATDNLGSVKVTGIVSNSNGQSTAILETKSASYIVEVGEKVAGSSWEVSEIGDDFVTFSNDGSQKTVYMDGE